MYSRSAAIISLTICFIAGTVACGFAQSPLSGFDRERYRGILSALKSDLQKYYYDATFHGMDLESRFKQADEKIKVATSQDQIFAIIAQALVDLEDSHTYFVPPHRSSTTEYGWQMQMIGDKCYVVAVKPGSDAEVKGLKEGDEIYSIDGFEPTRKNLWKIQYTYRAVRPRPGIRLVVIKPDGRQQQLDVMAKVKQGKRVLDISGPGNDMNDLIREAENEERLNEHRYYEFGEELFVWKMHAFDLDDSKVDEMVANVKKRRTLILDLRGNGGGYETTLLRLISNLFDRDVKIGDINRRKESKPLIAKSRGTSIFTGKLIVLIDSRSGSAAELFSRVVQLENRGIVIGDVSAGAVMRSKYHDHQLGLDTVIFYGASITDADIVMRDGKSLERVGVIPDELKMPTALELSRKLDPVLTYAASLAGVTITSDKAGSLFPTQWRK